jgi:hypothetical protein
MYSGKIAVPPGGGGIRKITVMKMYRSKTIVWRRAQRRLQKLSETGTVMNAVFINFILLPSRKIFTFSSTNSDLS